MLTITFAVVVDPMLLLNVLLNVYILLLSYYTQHVADGEYLLYP